MTSLRALPAYVLILASIVFPALVCAEETAAKPPVRLDPSKIVSMMMSLQFASAREEAAVMKKHCSAIDASFGPRFDADLAETEKTLEKSYRVMLVLAPMVKSGSPASNETASRQPLPLQALADVVKQPSEQSAMLPTLTPATKSPLKWEEKIQETISKLSQEEQRERCETRLARKQKTTDKPTSPAATETNTAAKPAEATH